MFEKLEIPCIENGANMPRKPRADPSIPPPEEAVKSVRDGQPENKDI
jgi:hypothetical protein